MGMDHHIPETPTDGFFASSHATGMRMIHREKRLMNIGISVSPAPRSTPFMTNITENRM